MTRLRIALVAGEASGDLLAAYLIKALRARLPEAEFFGIGGPKMEAQGLEVWVPAEKLSVRGYAEVLGKYVEISRIRKSLLKRLRDEKPDVFIGVDAPDFNLWLESRLKRYGIPVIHFVSPSIWAWRGKRIDGIIKSVSRMLVLFPFEPALYAPYNLPVDYVGHPQADLIPDSIDRHVVRAQLELDDGSPIFTLLPGSRQSELQYLGATFVRTAILLRQRFPEAKFLVPLVTRETRLLFETAMWEHGAQDLPFKLMFGHAHEAMAAADVVLVASGTATLEAALIKRPMVICYRMSPWSWRMMKKMRYQPWVGLPNILAGRFLVPEFLQNEATPENLAQAMGNLAGDIALRDRLETEFQVIHRSLRQDTATKAAHAVLRQLGLE